MLYLMQIQYQITMFRALITSSLSNTASDSSKNGIIELILTMNIFQIILILVKSEVTKAIIFH